MTSMWTFCDNLTNDLNSSPNENDRMVVYHVYDENIKEISYFTFLV